MPQRDGKKSDTKTLSQFDDREAEHQSTDQSEQIEQMIRWDAEEKAAIAGGLFSFRLTD